MLAAILIKAWWIELKHIKFWRVSAIALKRILIQNELVNSNCTTLYTYIRYKSYILHRKVTSVIVCGWAVNKETDTSHCALSV